MAILVNTSRTVKPTMSDADKGRYSLGVWPYQKGQTLPDIEESADVLFGVTHGVITFGASVNRVVPAASDPNRWEVIPTSTTDQWVQDLVGQRVALDFAWKQGQGWPVKLVDTGALRGAHLTGDPEVALGSYRLTLDSDGLAHLYLPRGGDVRVHAAA